MLRLNAGVRFMRRASIAFEIAGPDAVTWEPSTRGAVALAYIARQAACIGGGTLEMQRNLISERLMEMPREPAADVGRPFREVRH
jgi:alkylation response protein AidB-like acyl-CoA dehydrogenase